MKYQSLLLRCECGRPTTRIRDVGFTPYHELVLHWRCAKCKRHAYILKSLADCWRICPNPQDLEREAKFSEGLISEGDAGFLHNLGIRLEDDLG